MTTLPNRNTIAGVGATYGQVRSALGDLRDFLSESLGTSGTSPVIDGATIKNSTSLGVGISTPGTTAQVVGSMSVTATATAVNPGDGGLFLSGKQVYSNALGSKLEFLTASGDPLSIGRQTDSLYLRTKTTGNFNVYAGGSHSDTANTPGTGGEELLRVSSSDFRYKGQTIYHSGNGVFIRKDAADTAGEKITFAKGLKSDLKLEVGTATAAAPIEFLGTDTGNRIKLFATANEEYNIGVQANSVFLRTNEHFTIYKGGVFSPLAQTPGAGGIQLFNVNSTGISYKGNTVYHAGNADFVSKTSTARPGVIRVYNESADDDKFFVGQFNARGDGRMWLVSNGGGVRVSYADEAAVAHYRAGTTRPLVYEESPTRTGVTTMWIANQDSNIYTQMHWNGSRMQFIASRTTGETFETMVGRANSAGSADTCNRANVIHGHGIDDGTVRYHELSRGEGSAGGTVLFGLWDVHDYTFGAPLTVNITAPYHVFIGGGAGGNTRRWKGNGSSGISGSSQVIWQYITGSGDPYIWVQTDDRGNIIGTWDAEDPADREEPDLNPLQGTPNTYRFQIPSIEYVIPILEKYLDKNPDSFREQFEAQLKLYASSRYMMKEYTPGMDLREFVLDLPGDEQKKNWRTQAIIRALTTQLGDNNKRNIHLILSEVYKVDNKGKLIIK